MAEKRQETGASDPTFDLVSTLYHALQAAEFALRAQDDARKAGDSELAALFEHTQDVNRDLADRARALLAERMGAQVQGKRKRAAGRGAKAGARKAEEGRGEVIASGAVVHAGPESDQASHKQPPRNLEYRERDEEGRRKADVVEEASMESFPASDAPAY